MMLRYSFNLEKEAVMIEQAVRQVMEDGYRTPDLMEEGKKLVNTVQMGDLVKQSIENS
jgi:3-isopropylmalate dehydrogenase